MPLTRVRVDHHIRTHVRRRCCKRTCSRRRKSILMRNIETEKTSRLPANHTTVIRQTVILTRIRHVEKLHPSRTKRRTQIHITVRGTRTRRHAQKRRLLVPLAAILSGIRGARLTVHIHRRIRIVTHRTLCTLTARRTIKPIPVRNLLVRKTRKTNVHHHRRSKRQKRNVLHHISTLHQRHAEITVRIKMLQTGRRQRSERRRTHTTTTHHAAHTIRKQHVARHVHQRHAGEIRSPIR